MSLFCKAVCNLTLTTVTLVATLATFEIANSRSEDPPTIKQLLSEAIDEMETTRQLDRRTIIDVLDMQLRIGEIEDARRAFRLFIEARSGPGSLQLRDLGRQVIKDRDPVDFQQLLTFFKEVTVAIPLSPERVSELEEMKINMVARAARRKQINIANAVLDQMAVPPELVRTDGESLTVGHDTITAAKFFQIELLENEMHDESLAVLSRFQDLGGRVRVAAEFFRMNKFDPAIEKQIDELLVGASNVNESLWIRSKLLGVMDRGAPEREDVDKLLKLIERLRKLDAIRHDYLQTRVAKFLLEHGDKEAAAKLIKDGTESTPESTPTDRIDRFAERQLAKQHIAAGNLEDAIRICGAWSRDDVKSSTRLTTSGRQPLHNVARDFANAGEVDQALAIAEKIEDDYWRIDTVRSIARKIRRTQPMQSLTLLQQAWADAGSIEPARDRSWLRRNLVGDLVSDDVPFDALMSRINQLDVARDKAIALSGQMEFRIKGDLSDESIKQAIELISAGDPTYLEYVVDILVDEKKTDLAAMAALKINYDPRYDRGLQGTFALIRKDWPLEKQMQFLADVSTDNRAPLLLAMIDQPDEASQALVQQACIKQLTEAQFDQPLFKVVLAKAIEQEDEVLLGRVTRLTFKEDWQVRDARTELESHWNELLRNDSLWMNFAEKVLTADWAKESCQLVHFRHDIESKDYSACMDRINANPASSFRAKLRFLLAKHFYAKTPR